MSMINTNINSLNAQRNLAGTATALSTAMSRLSSGLRVNSAKDDAAGLAIAERMNAQTKGMNVAIRNANDAISLAATAEGALGAISNNLQRMRELAVQGANGTNGATDINALDEEYKLLVAENTRVIAATKFNSQALLSAATAFSFQVGANAGEAITVTATVAAQTATTGRYQCLVERTDHCGRHRYRSHQHHSGFLGCNPKSFRVGYFQPSSWL